MDLADSVRQQLSAVVTEMMAKYQVPGAAAAVVYDQSVAWSSGFGLADMDAQAPAEADTVFRCASVTKPFTATAIMRLRDEGKLSLDDPLVRHVPEFRAATNPFGPIEDITLRRLITHHSGLQSEAPSFDYWDTLEFPPIEGIVKSLGSARVAIPPDSAFKYCNLGFILLGETVARKSGRRYHEYVVDRILKPLGMNMSGYVPTPAMSARMAIGYEPDPPSDRPTIAPHTPINGRMPAGGLYSSASDLARWLSLQFRTDRPADDGAQVISGKTLEEMHRPLYMSPAWDTAYCVSWHAQVRPGGAIHYHGGGLPAFSTMTAFDKARKVGAVVLTNLGGHDGAKESAVSLIDAAAGALSESAATRVPHESTSEPSQPVPDDLRRYLGLYQGRGAQQALIAWRGGQLMLLPPWPGSASRFGPAVLRPRPEPDSLLVDGGRGSGEVARFERDAAGELVAFRLAATVFRKFRQSYRLSGSPEI
ncbi:MAG: beta-lactamase family protein [Chloroflexi bacterium]|nr:beta-lactamase family protein [Chloroflexota bacterium]